MRILLIMVCIFLSGCGNKQIEKNEQISQEELLKEKMQEQVQGIRYTVSRGL